MKKLLEHCFLLIALSLVSGSVGGEALPGEPLNELRYFPEHSSSVVWVRGSSTVNEWECVQNQLGGLIEANVSPSSLVEALEQMLHDRSGTSASPPPIENLEAQIWIQVDANGLICGSSRMKRDLLNAIRAKDHPTIDYQFQTLVALPEVKHTSEGSFLKLRSRGSLSLGGETENVEHTTEVRLIEGSTIELRGRIALNMSDFNIKPPSALLGLIRAHDSFDVEYRVRIETADL